MIVLRTNTRDEAIAAADDALKLDGMDSTVLGFPGCAPADPGLLCRAFDILKYDVELNAANVQAWRALGSDYLLNNETQQAIECLPHGIEISPLDARLAIWQAVLAIAYLQGKNFKIAQANAQLACQRDVRSYLPRLVLSAVHMARGNDKYAAASLKEVYRIKPDLSNRERRCAIGKNLAASLMPTGK